MNKLKPKIIAVIGPTASGKSDLAIKLANDFNGEVVSADSRQFYKGMDIGTGKVNKNDRKRAKHHLIDFLRPDEDYNLYDFQRDAFKAIDSILKKEKLPILAGGTGLFVSSVIENYSLSNAPVDVELRKQLNKLSNEELIKRLLDFDPDTHIDINNKRRVIRQLEYFLNDPNYKPGTKEPRYDVLIIQPYYTRDALYKKINKRVEEMFLSGLTKEVDTLAKIYGFKVNAMSGIGYREFSDYYDIKNLPQYKIKNIKDAIKKNSRHYAKRQMTWFKKYSSKSLFNKDYTETKIQVQKFLSS